MVKKEKNILFKIGKAFNDENFSDLPSSISVSFTSYLLCIFHLFTLWFLFILFPPPSPAATLSLSLTLIPFPQNCRMYPPRIANERQAVSLNPSTVLQSVYYTEGSCRNNNALTARFFFYICQPNFCKNFSYFLIRIFLISFI